ncbi:hypothetical protein GCM10020220_085690 [Nonomuraea rubra]
MRGLAEAVTQLRAKASHVAWAPCGADGADAHRTQRDSLTAAPGTSWTWPGEDRQPQPLPQLMPDILAKHSRRVALKGASGIAPASGAEGTPFDRMARTWRPG